MAYTKSADGVAKKGKTNVQVMANDGQDKGVQKGGKKKAGVSNESMKSVGRNLARASNQGGR